MVWRYFHLYYEHNRIEEISFFEFRKWGFGALRSKKPRLLLKVNENDVYLRKGEHFLYIPRKQFENVISLFPKKRG